MVGLAYLGLGRDEEVPRGAGNRRRAEPLLKRGTGLVSGRGLNPLHCWQLPGLAFPSYSLSFLRM